MYAIVLVFIAGASHYLNLAPGLLDNILLFIAVLIHSSMLWGAKRTAIYIASVMLISYFAEFIGTHTGWIFGDYYYNTSLPGLLYGVPILIPLVYSFLAYSAHFVLFAISRKLIHSANLIFLALLTGFIMMLTDLGTDPIHSTVAQIWIWPHGGAIFGVPIHNFIGWWGVFIVITLVAVPLAWLRKDYPLSVKFEPSVFYMPLALFFMVILFGFTSALQVPAEYQVLGDACAFIMVLTLSPYLILAWLNGIKKFP
jgi:putative membrane protein